MSSLPTLTEAAIRQIATSQSFSRGRDYYERGAVLGVERRGDVLRAQVEGSQYAPYQVRVTLDATGISDTHCTCQYDWGGACKHVVAVLLACLHEPERVEERAPVEELLAKLEPDQLRPLLFAAVERQPDLADLIERQVRQWRSESAAPADTPTPRQRQTPLDTDSYRRQVSAALRSLDRMRPSEAYWHVGEVVGKVHELARRAVPFFEAGDGRSALAILEAVTEEYVAGWTGLDDSSGEPSGLFADLGELWTEAILSTELTPEERQMWADRLTQWQAEIADYGPDEAFDAAQAAALQGWDDPELQRVLRGEIADQEDWQGSSLWYADDLIAARLKVLKRQGRVQEYLNLARASGKVTDYVTALVRSGRVQEAVDYGLANLATADEALALCRALDECAATREALRIAKHGLALIGARASLARWLRDRAGAVGQTEQALDAALLAMRLDPSLADYEAVEALAGEQWPALRERLLAHLRKADSAYPQAQVDVFLHEGLIDDAIAAVEPALHQYTLVEQVVDAAIKSHPDWVIRVCCQQAERIADEGKSKHYDYAVGWLERARSAYLASGRGAEWRAYLEDLVARHRRKYSLVPMLKGLL